MCVHLSDKLGSNVLDRVFQLDLLCYCHTIVYNPRTAVLALQYNIASLQAYKGACVFKFVLAAHHTVEQRGTQAKLLLINLGRLLFMCSALDTERKDAPWVPE